MLFLAALYAIGAPAEPSSHEAFREWVRAAAEADGLHIESWGTLDLDRDGQADDVAAWLCDPHPVDPNTGSPWLVWEVDGRRGVVERTEEVACWKPPDGPPEFRELHQTGVSISAVKDPYDRDFKDNWLEVVDGHLEVTRWKRGTSVSFPTGTLSWDYLRRSTTGVKIEWLPDSPGHLEHTVESTLILVAPDDTERPTLNRVVSGAEVYGGTDDASFSVVAVEPAPEQLELVIRVTDDLHTAEDRLELRWRGRRPLEKRDEVHRERRLSIAWPDDRDPVTTWVEIDDPDTPKPQVVRRSDGAFTVRFTHDDLGLMHRRFWDKSFTVVFIDVDVPSEPPTHIATSDLAEKPELSTSASIVRHPDLHPFPTHLPSTREELAITAIRELDAGRTSLRRTEEDMRRAQAERQARIPQVLQSLPASMVEIPSGTFVMGCDPERDIPASYWEVCVAPELPAHQVSISRFLLMRTEVTQEQWESVMGSNASTFWECGADCPVESVSWLDAVRFANAVSELAGLELAYTISGETVSWNPSANGYRLPTEAEWEYAAAGGEKHAWAGSSNADSVAWHLGNSLRATKPVCKKQPNGYGLCDMSGNVAEWVWDWYGEYPAEAATDPVGPATGRSRVIRGGSWAEQPKSIRIAERHHAGPERRGSGLGFRLARSAP